MNEAPIDAPTPPPDLDTLLAIPEDRRRLEALLHAAWTQRDGDAETLQAFAERANEQSVLRHDRVAHLTALSLLAHAHFRRTRYAQAQRHGLEALREAHLDPRHDAHGWDHALSELPRRAREALGQAVTALAISTFRRTDYPNALLYANLEVHLKRALEDRIGEAQARHGLGWGYDKVGLYQRALEHHNEALEALEALEPAEPALTASPLNGIAATYLNLGYFDEALAYSERALEVLPHDGQRRRERSTALRAIGMVRQRQGDYGAAESWYRRSIAVSDAYGISLNLISLGEMELELGHPEEARDHFLRCLDELEPDVRRRSRCQALIGLGDAHLASGDPAAALATLTEALEAAREIGSPVELNRTHHSLSRAHRELGHWDVALEHHEAFHRYREQVLREASDVRMQVLSLQFEVERLRKDREIDRLRNVELARTYQDLQELHAKLERQAAELERLSHLDGLTGLRNRRSLDRHLASEVARARRSGDPLALLMLDIDHFKAINDRFSHTVGDEVLRKLARSLRQQLRDVDLSARFGGEEFVLLLPDTDAPGARQVAEKVRLAVEEGTGGTVHPELAVTVSVGVAMLAPGDDATDLLARADAMLYRAKQSGRNRVCG
jgi:diguanylate cyclase (GGDEF)-like protein